MTDHTMGDTAAVHPVAAPPAKVEHVVTPAGIEVWHVHSDLVPLVAMSFVFAGGAAQDPAGRPGVAQMVSRLLDEGAGPHDSDSFQGLLADRAIEIGFNVGQDTLGGALKTLLPHLDTAADMLRLALAEPRFDPDAIERVRAQTMAGIRYQMNDPGVRATKRFFAEAFPGHPYSLPNAGTLDSLAAITRDDLLAMHRRLVARGRLTVAVVGALDSTGVAALVDRVFADLPATPELAPVAPALIGNRGARHVVDLDVPQSVIRFGMHGIAWSDPDFIPAFVFNHILGGGVFTSRLFQEVREKRGLAYSVGTSLVSYRSAAMTWGYTATKNERVGEAIDVIASEIARLAADGPEPDELGKAKAYLTGSYPLGFDTSTKIAHQLVQVAFEGLGRDYLARRNLLVAAVSAEDIARAAERIVGDGAMLVVIAGRPTGL